MLGTKKIKHLFSFVEIRYWYFVLLSVVYLPLIIYGGFGTSDDFALIEGANNDFMISLKASLTRVGHTSRPIYALLQIFTLYAFGKLTFLYTLFRLSIWFLNLRIAVKLFKDILGEQTTWIFILLFSFPFFTSSHLMNCFQTGYLIAMLFWLLSLYFIRGIYLDSGPKKIVLSSFFIFLSLLSCEIMFPLFIINAGLPLLYRISRNKSALNKGKMATKKILIHLVVLFAIYAFFKFFITKIYQPLPGTYGWDFSENSIYQACYYFITLITEIPILLIKVIGYFILVPWLWATFIIVPIIYKIHKNYFTAQKKIGREKSIHRRYFFYLILVSLFSCSFIFLFSNYPAVTFGNYNKMLLPSFLIICLIGSYLFSLLIQKKLWYISAVVLILWTGSMIIQINNFNESWKIRKTMLSDCASSLDNTNLGDDPYVICNVPFYLLNNYNNEHVFWQSWDFSAGLNYFGLNKQIRVFPFCWQTLFNENYYPFHNINHNIKSTDKNLWVYEYDQKNKTSSLKQIGNFKTYKIELQKRRINYHSIITTENIRMELIEIWKNQ